MFLVLLLALSADPVSTKIEDTDARSATELAQAVDVCMTTFAVRLTKTDRNDDFIYTEANEFCQPLKLKLRDAVAREYPADQASKLNAQLDAQARPNFFGLLARIRADRAARARD